MDVEMRIRGLMMDPNTNMPIVILKDVASDTVLPIWVGIYEANAIAIEIEKLAAPRPMTHDLARNLIQYLNGRLDRVVITELKDDTFYAVLWLTHSGEPVTVDARPSDAIALALRADCPIYVAEPVLAVARLNTAGPPDSASAEQLRKWLEGLNDEDLGRYKM
jgi:bifunctional DNase/RNase